MKGIQQYFLAVLFIMWLVESRGRNHSNKSYWAVLSCGTVYYAVQGGSNVRVFWMKCWSVTIQMKATERDFPVVLFLMLYEVVLTFELVDVTLKRDHWNESYRALLASGTFYNAVQGGSNFRVVRSIPKVKWELLSSTFRWYCLLCFTRWFYPGHPKLIFGKYLFGRRFGI